MGVTGPDEIRFACLGLRFGHSFQCATFFAMSISGDKQPKGIDDESVGASTSRIDAL